MMKIKFFSIEDTSLLRKFSVLFSLMSFLPFIILSIILFFNIIGKLNLNPNILFWSVIIVGVFALMGFFGMRASIISLIKVTRSTKDILSGKFYERINLDGMKNNEINHIAKAFNDVIEKLEFNIRKLQKSRGLLHEILTKVASGVSSIENINMFIDLIIETTVNALDAKIGLLLLVDEGEKELIVESYSGPRSSFYSKGQKIPLNVGVTGWVYTRKEPLLIPQLHLQKSLKTMEVDNVNLAFHPPLICAPLTFQNRVVGVLTVSGKVSEKNFEEDELIILSNISSQIALAIANIQLNADAQKTYLETITALALAVEVRDPYSRGHSDRVSGYAEKIAQRLGLDAINIKTIKDAAMLHDVGKIGISDEILRKQDLLNEYEREIMQQHPIIGEGIIIPLRGLVHLRDPIRHHHERLNGGGYPDGLKNGEISIEAKILAVADTFDAMVTDRPYRKGLAVSQAKEELINHKEIHYDAKVVDCFMECI